MDHDLHSLLAAARDDAPPPRLSIDDITAAGRQLVRRRRRTTLLSSVAGGIVAVITGATAAVVLLSPPSNGPALDPNGNPGIAGASPSAARRTDFTQVTGFETNYTGYTSGRFTVSAPELVTADYQQSSIELSPAAPVASPTGRPSTAVAPPAGAADPASDPPPGKSTPARTISPDDGTDDVSSEGRLVVYDTDAFDVREFTGGDRLQIAGRVALLRYAGGPSGPSAAGKRGCCMTPTVPTLAWQYMPDTWAAIYWSSFDNAPTREELVALAEALPADDPHPFPVGIQLRKIPDNYRLLAVSRGTTSRDAKRLSVVRLAPKPPAPPLYEPIAFDDYPSIVLTLGVTDKLILDLVGKTSCSPSGTTCVAFLKDGEYFLQVELVGGAKALSSGELSQILKSMVAEQPTDQSAWPAADTVFTP